MKKNKGFTLVELLAVIVITAIIITVAVPSVLTFSENQKKNLYCSKVDTIKKAAQLYGEDNYDSIFNGKISSECLLDGEVIQRCQKIKVSALLAKNYLKKEENATTGVKDEMYDPRDNTSMKDDEIYVTIKNKKAYVSYIYKTKEDADLCDGTFYKSSGSTTVDPEDKDPDIYNKDTSVPTCKFTYNVSATEGWFNNYPTPTVTTSEAGSSGLQFGYGLTSTPNYDLGYVQATKVGKKTVAAIREDTGGKDLYCFVKSMEGSENVTIEKIKIDTGKPTLSLSQTSNSTLAKSHTVTVTISDTLSGLPKTNNIKYAWTTSNSTAPADSVWKTLTITGSDLVDGKGTTSAISKDIVGSGITGTYYLWIKAGSLSDVAGNKWRNGESDYVVGPFRLDNTGPTVPTSVIRKDNASGTVVSNSSSWTNETRWWGSFSSNDSDSGVNHYEYSTNCTGSKTNNLSTSYTYSSSVDYTFCIRAVDNLGNTSDWSSAYYFKIDKDKPSTPNVGLYKWTNNSTAPTSTSGLTAYTNNTWSNLKVATFASGSTDTGGSGLKEYQYTTTGTTTNKTNQKATQRNIEANGTSYIKWRACDNVGNCSDWSTTYTIKIDKNQPTCSIEKTDTGDTEGVDYKITCSDTGGSGVSKCAGNTSSTTVNKTNKTAGATHYVYDAAGNSNSCSVTITSQRQRSTCSTYKTCSNSSCGAAYCTSSCCGGYYSGTISCWNSASSVYDTFSCSNIGQVIGSSSYCKSIGYSGQNMGSCTYQNSSCTSSACCGYKSCADSSCGCKTWGSWTNVSSCSAVTSIRKCRTIYK